MARPVSNSEVEACGRLRLRLREALLDAEAKGAPTYVLHAALAGELVAVCLVLGIKREDFIEVLKKDWDSIAGCGAN